MLNNRKFWYGGYGLIDVKCHPEPSEAGSPCASVPSAHLVSPQGEDYACQPIPSPRSPPWGPKLLMDAFHDPESRKPIACEILQQLPKKMTAAVDLDKAEVREAWGIYFPEGLDWLRIWIVLLVAFSLPSLLFDILWGVLRHDISGCFGVACWWMAGVAIATGIMGTRA